MSSDRWEIILKRLKPDLFPGVKNWVRFVIRAWPGGRRGCFAVLIWLLEQSRLGGELPLVDPARLVDEKPTDQHVVLIRDKAVIQRAFLCRFVAALGRAFFCYQLLTPQFPGRSQARP